MTLPWLFAYWTLKLVMAPPMIAACLRKNSERGVSVALSMAALLAIAQARMSRSLCRQNSGRFTQAEGFLCGEQAALESFERDAELD